MPQGTIGGPPKTWGKKVGSKIPASPTDPKGSPKWLPNVRPVKQGRGARASRPNKIGASTPYHFRGKNLTPYGGLLPVATLLEKLDFQALLEETITTKRITRAMSPYQFVLALVLGLYVGFARLNQLRFIARDPILTGILKVTRLPPQSTLWRFLASLHLNVAQQILSIQRQLREQSGPRPT